MIERLTPSGVELDKIYGHWDVRKAIIETRVRFTLNAKSRGVHKPRGCLITPELSRSGAMSEFLQGCGRDAARDLRGKYSQGLRVAMTHSSGGQLEKHAAQSIIGGESVLGVTGRGTRLVRRAGGAAVEPRSVRTSGAVGNFSSFDRREARSWRS